MPAALRPYIIEPIFEQFEALLPERRTNPTRSAVTAPASPTGCPDRVVFGKLVEVLVFGLVFGCAYRRIADESCSESTRCVVVGATSGSRPG